VNTYDVIIIGGGLAGLTAALHLARNKHAVLLFEKQAYPHHKVCGEYVSKEVMPYLNRLGVTLSKAVDIDTLTLSAHNGKQITTKLPLGGVGISRFAFDNTLYQKALENGAQFNFSMVDDVSFANNSFTVSAGLEKYRGTFVIGAFGKRSNLDKKLNRSFILKKSSWLGVKAHFKYDSFPENKVALHNFEGGYGGLSKTESGAVNFCYLTSYDSFKKEKDIHSFNTNVVAKNPHLGAFLREAKPLFEKPLSIAQVSFHPKKSVEHHILMCGDTAGLIHPLCGNGMAMAIHSAKIVSELISDAISATKQDRTYLETSYTKAWSFAFQKRMQTGRHLQSLLLNSTASKVAMTTLAKAPWLMQHLLKRTHGTSIT